MNINIVVKFEALAGFKSLSVKSVVVGHKYLKFKKSPVTNYRTLVYLIYMVNRAFFSVNSYIKGIRSANMPSAWR